MSEENSKDDKTSNKRTATYNEADHVLEEGILMHQNNSF